MKKLIIFYFIFLTGSAFSQDAKYMQAMEKNIAISDSATSDLSFQISKNGFERIAQANPGEWLPLYYQSYCLCMLGVKQSENSKKDEYFDQAEKLINRADSLSPQNSEIYVMRGFITGLLISVDPATRGQLLGQKSAMYNSQAVQFDKENPRAYLIRGTGLMYTPPQYGGGKDAAMKVLEMAVEKYKTFKPSSPIMPNWGKARADQMLEQCKKME